MKSHSITEAITASEIKPFTALIADDEKMACDNLKNMLQHFTGIHICGSVNNTAEAEHFIKHHHPDVVFLDIEMPNENAFTFLNRIHPFSFEVIFVTAYDEFAVRAFKLNAVDYIVKPIIADELAKAIEKVRQRLLLKNLLQQESGLYSNLSQHINRKSPRSITLRDTAAIEVVDFNNLLYVEAKGSYSRIVFLKNNAEKEIMMSHSIAEYEELLPAGIFYRIHKSYLVNCDHVSKIIKEDIPYVKIGDGPELPISRRRYSSFLFFLKGSRHYNA